MTEEERLASLRAYLTEQTYIQPGGGEILPYNSTDPEGGFNSTLIGSPWQGGSMSFKMAPSGYHGSLAPPRYEKDEKAAEEHPPKERKPSIIDRLKGKHGEKKEEESHKKESTSS